VAYQFYVSIKGTKQGQLKGSAHVPQSSQQPGRMAAIRFSGEIASAVDTTTGQASGKRQHQPFVVTRELDEASPQLFQAAATNETLQSVLLELLKTEIGGGTETVFYTILLTNATVSDYRWYAAPLPEGGSDIFELEDVAFSFQQIAVGHNIAGTSASTSTAGSRASAPNAWTAQTAQRTPVEAVPVRTPARYVNTGPRIGGTPSQPGSPRPPGPPADVL
jgi:type VI secretion system secreted protein Hcp